MAEAAPEWSERILCRYYMHGICKEGDNCRYSHCMASSKPDMASSKPDMASSKPDMACKFYQQGKCSYGESCRYDHVKPSRPLEENKSEKSTKSANSLKPVNLPRDTGQASGSKMVTLKKQGHSADSGLGEEIQANPASTIDPSKWVKAAEFVPGQAWQGSFPSSYLKAAQSGIDETERKEPEKELTDEEKGKLMCPFAAHSTCRYGENCAYMHGDICELCGAAALHPTDETIRNKHMEECMKQHEEDMELSFAIQRSKDKACGICMDLVLEKNPPTERRFGILSNCTHVFCLTCIRKWRSAKQFENKIIRACPECRVKSDFVTPSKYWVEDEDEKLKLIQGYKGALSRKPCKYFNQGNGECPFNENCFYEHAYPDGRKASPKPKRRRQRHNADGDLDLVRELLLWNFFEERENRRERTLTVEFQWDDDLDDLFLHANLWDWSDTDSDDMSDLEHNPYFA